MLLLVPLLLVVVVVVVVVRKIGASGTHGARPGSGARDSNGWASARRSTRCRRHKDRDGRGAGEESAEGPRRHAYSYVLCPSPELAPPDPPHRHQATTAGADGAAEREEDGEEDDDDSVFDSEEEDSEEEEEEEEGRYCVENGMPPA